MSKTRRTKVEVKEKISKIARARVKDQRFETTVKELMQEYELGQLGFNGEEEFKWSSME